MRTFKSKRFAKFARKERITDGQLCQAVIAAEKGLIDADLGGGVIKQRIARLNEGKSGGYRPIILFRLGHRAFFVHGFAKNDQANIDVVEEADFMRLASLLLEATDVQITALLKAKSFTEIVCDGEDQNL